MNSEYQTPIQTLETRPQDKYCFIRFRGTPVLQDG